MASYSAIASPQVILRMMEHRLRAIECSKWEPLSSISNYSSKLIRHTAHRVLRSNSSVRQTILSWSTQISFLKKRSRVPCSWHTTRVRKRSPLDSLSICLIKQLWITAFTWGTRSTSIQIFWSRYIASIAGPRSARTRGLSTRSAINPSATCASISNRNDRYTLMSVKFGQRGAFLILVLSHYVQLNVDFK